MRLRIRGHRRLRPERALCRVPGRNRRGSRPRARSRRSHGPHPRHDLPLPPRRTNVDGAAKGSDRGFTTIGARIEAEWASSVDLTEATLKAQINPQGAPTTYHLEYGTDTSYGTSTSERGVGSDESAHVVVNSLEGLSAGTTYHYRFVATNSVGVSEGPLRLHHLCAVDAGNQLPEPGVPHRCLLPPARLQGLRDGLAGRQKQRRPQKHLQRLVLPSSARAELRKREQARLRLLQAPSPMSQAAPYANEYLAARGPDGGLTADLNAPRDEGLYELKADQPGDLEVQYKSFTPDLLDRLGDERQRHAGPTADALERER